MASLVPAAPSCFLLPASCYLLPVVFTYLTLTLLLLDLSLSLSFTSTCLTLPYLTCPPHPVNLLSLALYHSWSFRTRSVSPTSHDDILTTHISPPSAITSTSYAILNSCIAINRLCSITQSPLSKRPFHSLTGRWPACVRLQLILARSPTPLHRQKRPCPPSSPVINDPEPHVPVP